VAYGWPFAASPVVTPGMKGDSIPYPRTLKDRRMDNLRPILFFSLAIIGLMLYQAWIHDYGTFAATPPKTNAATVITRESPVLPIPQATLLKTGTSTPSDTSGRVALSSADMITVETDVLRAQISTRGGTLGNLYLLDYPVTPEQPKIKFQLFKNQEPDLYTAQTGLIGDSTGSAPSLDSLFTATASTYQLMPDQKSITAELVWTAPSGIKVTKRFIFHRGKYLIDLEQMVENASSAPWPVRSYAQLQRSKPEAPKGTSFVRTYTGAAYYSPQDKYKKLGFDDIAKNPPLHVEVADGWVAMVQHHFLSAWIARPSETETFYTSSLPDSRYIIGLYSPSVTIPAGGIYRFSDHLFAGPKLQKHLAEIAQGLDLTVDYGWLTVLAQPIFWLLDQLHSLFHNWGVAIIFLTVFIKAAFYKLSETSYKSMANMRQLTPKLQALKERYGEDKERLNQAMMEMYKKEKVNPLGGCLPIVIQIPVFISLYWVLLESVEMRQAPFALWITNLSAPDPYFVLPLIMGVSMFIQQKLNPAPVDPLQAKIMMGMPIIFTVFFAFFSSGLVLYWVVNNLLSIAQQWHITRTIENVGAASK
jgi:YidC/Oxa1 family membrane protein insertase